MADEHYTIRDVGNHLVQVNLKRDKRLRRRSRWERMPDGSLLLRVPYRLPKRYIGPMLEQIAKQLDKATENHKRRNDVVLQRRAEMINQKYFDGKVRWNAIRWVSNMQARLGSCSRGGPTDGEIRISDKIKKWPDWVIDYVIAHEMVHRKHPNHSAAFWSELHAAYPRSERALGFIQGMGFATGQPMDEEA